MILIKGYSGGGYVTGLSERLVTKGGGIRNTVVVEESGLYNITLRYYSDIAGKANIYVGNTAVTLGRLNKTVSLAAGNKWQDVTASVYLQKGINVVDLDMTVEAALDYMRVRALPSQDYSTTIEAENAIPDGLKDSIQIANSSGASGGKYVAGIEGSYSDPDYLQFDYIAAAAGKYQMQVFHSNEGLAGTHSYNIKVTDKYAVVDVNGQSDSPKFILPGDDDNDGPDIDLYYFVDCGDHDPETLSDGDEFGINNSVTDRLYGKDTTGYSWGVLMVDDNEVETPGEGGMISSPDDKAIYTNYQKALSNATADLKDGQSKHATFRYAHGQDAPAANINPRYVAYKFELDPGEYAVTVGMSNIWGNGGSPTVTLSADGVEDVSKAYSMNQGSRQEETQIINLTDATKNNNDKVELVVMATATTATLQMTHIEITNVPESLYYFVDCGDHNPETLSDGDEFGINNSVTDRLYGEDITGYSWGVLMVDDNEVETPGVGGMISSPDDKAIYTNYQKALSNSESDFVDGQSKHATFRYAHGQDAPAANINPRYVAYKFELDAGEYAVTVGMSNTWGNGGSPTITLSADGIEDVSKAYSMNQGSRQEETQIIDLTDAAKNDNDRVELVVMATATTDTLQMTHIEITGALMEEEKDFIFLPPYGVKALAGDDLPDDIYVGELAKGIDWFIDYRNLKDDTDRHFFMNTFSDDTFDEKTITLDLKEGSNTIRIYNDNSWNVTHGGTTGEPGLTNMPNYTPNFDKFVITPMALDSPVQLAEEYMININSTEAGTVFADKNIVEKNGQYTLSMIPQNDYSIVKLLINDVDKTSSIAFNETMQTYNITVYDISEDQDIKVYFAKPFVSKGTLQNLYDSCKDIERGTYSRGSWEQFDSARENVKNLLNKEEAYDWEINNAYNLLLSTINGLKDISNLVYFVDCGDHDPSTLSIGDDFGRNNKVTDQMYGEDATGYNWGVSIEPEGLAKGEKETPGQGGMVSDPDDKAIYTTYQKALSNSQSDLLDGQSKDATFRYAHNQDSSGINPRYVAYKFELDPGEYSVTVGMSNTWNNGGSPTVTLSADEIQAVSRAYSVSNGGKREETQTIDLTNAKTNTEGRVELLVKATAGTPTLQMTYITIEEIKEISVLDRIEVTAPTVVEYKTGEALNTDGMVVRAVYSDGSSKILTAGDYEIKGYDPNQVGMQTVIVSYEGKSATFEVIVTDEVSIDKSLLKDSIDAANLAKENYPENLIEAVRLEFEAALAHAIEVYNDTTNRYTQEDVDAADSELVRTMQYLDLTADINGLKNAIEHAKKMISSGLYEDDNMMMVYKSALADAEALLKEENITDKEIQPAIKALSDAEANLNLKKADRLDFSRLQREIVLSDSTKQLLHLYIDGAYKDAFNAELNKAKELLSKAQANPSEITQKEIDIQASALCAARTALRPITNKDVLKSLIDAANAIDTTKYTDVTVKHLKKALDTAKAVYADELANQKTVDEAESALKSALDGLVQRTEDGDNVKTGDSTNLIGLFLLLIGSLGSIVAIIIRRKKVNQSTK